MNDEYRRMMTEMWDQNDESDEDEADPMAPVVAALAEVSSGFRDAAADLSSSQRATSESMVEVLSQVVQIITKSHKDMVAGGKITGAQDIAVKLEGIRSAMTNDAKATQTMLMSLSQTMVSLGQRMEDMTKALSAPRMLIRDHEGRPVGVKIETQQRSIIG